MRIIIFISTILWTVGVFCQNSDSLGINNSPFLNPSEIALLNSLLEEQRGAFDFKDKKVAFITGSTGGKIVQKSDYFKYSIIPWIERNSAPQIFMVQLNDNETLKSGGYEVLVLSWVKLFTDRRKKKVIKQLAKKK